SVGGGVTFGVLGGGLGGFKCELQENVVAIAGCACYERGCWFAHVMVEFVIGLHIHVGVLRRLREPTCGVAFTGGGLWSAEPVEVGIFAHAKQMLVCRVALLVEHCYTCLWLLSALCWLVVNSGELLPEFFSVGSGRSCDRLGGAFWRVFPELCLGGSGGGSPKTCLRCFYSSACCSVFSDGPCCWPFGLCMLVKVLPRIVPLLILAEVVFLFIFKFLSCTGGTSCVPMVGCFVSLLVLYVLSQMVV
ncbi:hypothetical protein Taro_017583, partial [Colocasia esculenta]|nr:hypothetical protein [Colocasia esculenta]